MEIISAILAVFSGIGDWLITAIPKLMTMFYAEGALTFLGALGVAGLAVSVIFLCINVLVPKYSDIFAKTSLIKRKAHAVNS